MKKTTFFLLCLITTLPFISFGQTQTTIEDEYYSYFKLPREGLFLHLNKTTYFKGEEIWFKGYAYDQRNQLASKGTTNIKVGIYDDEGNQVKKGLYAAQNGVTYGNFAVDSIFSAGTYYIKAETNWMKNFKENDAFIQKIEILTDTQTTDNTKGEVAKYDFQFLPEGGHLVANTLSNIGFKVIDNNGKGVIASGVVYDSNKKEVASFKSNALGMGKFLLQPQKNTKYTAEITLKNDSTITTKLPEIKTQGISLMLQNSLDDKVILDFSTNEETLKNNAEKAYKILIHQSGKLKIATLQFSDVKKAVSIQRNQLFKGINIITVFDENKKPILERIFFNDDGIKSSKINVTKLNNVKDSIILSVNELQLNENANVSISILPEETEAYHPKHSIISAFYLKPHAKGFIENPKYYFENMDKKKKYELDILLLTQGWSRYDWKDIFSKKPLTTHRFENGITISGRVNRPASGVEQLFLHATKNHPAKFIDLDENQSFKLTNFFLEKEEEIRFSYINDKGALKKPSMYLRFLISNEEDKLSESYLNETKKIQSVTSNFNIPKDFFYENAEALDTVLLKAEKKKETPKFNNLFMNNPSVTEITLEEYSRYINIVQYLNFNGFNASEDMGRVFITSRIPKAGEPAVFFNDVRLRNFDILYNMSLAEIERIVTDRYSVIPTMQQQTTGVIKIYSRQTPLFKKSGNTAVYLSAQSPETFETGKKYYAPKYASYLNPIFQKYGTVSWLPMVELNTKDATVFKIYDTYTKNITLFIEGISESGQLISERKTIQIR
ncbi:hypothetical protein C8N46_11319 [Kordia periserrulae]|uniref:MG2 domain-containing protein n=1 Tax=Kordia periserrulae TaxID=701523 RepID=A0A2T6BR49_9FLAO|nr:hypothetical protein [Kordia periserrulae]PTX58529.1 hypothetical protein C8N46_11319 [Kordia periserrulae]